MQNRSIRLRNLISATVSFTFLLLVSVPSPLLAHPAPQGSAYLDGKDSKFGVVLLHGRGKHPKWLVVDPLRIGIHEKLGYHTLSLQMPISKSKYCEKKSPLKKLCWRQYAAEFPEAYRRIHAGVEFLAKKKGVRAIYLMGHSMGSRMATAFLAIHGGKGLPGSMQGGKWARPVQPDAGVAGFIGVGVRNGGGDPLDSEANLHRIADIPVLDVYGDGGNGRDAEHAGYRHEGKLTRRSGYTQVLIKGADHKFTAKVDDKPVSNRLVEVVVDWLKRLEGAGK